MQRPAAPGQRCAWFGDTRGSGVGGCGGEPLAFCHTDCVQAGGRCGRPATTHQCSPPDAGWSGSSLKARWHQQCDPLLHQMQHGPQDTLPHRQHREAEEPRDKDPHTSPSSAGKPISRTRVRSHWRGGLTHTQGWYVGPLHLSLQSGNVGGEGECVTPGAARHDAVDAVGAARDEPVRHLSCHILHMHLRSHWHSQWSGCGPLSGQGFFFERVQNLLPSQVRTASAIFSTNLFWKFVRLPHGAGTKKGTVPLHNLQYQSRCGFNRSHSSSLSGTACSCFPCELQNCSCGHSCSAQLQPCADSSQRIKKGHQPLQHLHCLLLHGLMNRK